MLKEIKKYNPKKRDLALPMAVLLLAILASPTLAQDGGDPALPFDFMPYLITFVSVVLVPLLISGDRPIGAVKVIGWVKNWTGLQDGAAVWLSVSMSVVLAVLLALVEGAIGLPITPESFQVMVVAIFGGSQLWYARIKDEKTPTE